jgi:hypothetical protein
MSHKPEFKEPWDRKDVCVAFTRSGAEHDAGRKMTNEEWDDFTYQWRCWSQDIGAQEAWQWHYFFKLHHDKYPNAVNPGNDSQAQAEIASLRMLNAYYRQNGGKV